MSIICDHHRWSYMMIIYDDHVWSSCMRITCDYHTSWQYKIITYDDHIRSLGMIIICDRRVWWSWTCVRVVFLFVFKLNICLCSGKTVSFTSPGSMSPACLHAWDHSCLSGSGHQQQFHALSCSKSSLTPHGRSLIPLLDRYTRVFSRDSRLPITQVILTGV